ncbi:MAG: hypothetical protein WC391_06255 [Methanoregula sp.]|jgi:hypothetical protein
MKTILLISLVTICLLAGMGAVSAYTTPESIVASGKVYVSGITYDPAAFFSGDTGTVAFDVTNGNTDQGIVINHATFADQLSDFKLLSGTYDYSATVGPGKTQTFTFNIKADASDGTYYPMFSISFRDADSLWEKTMVKIDNTPLILTVIDKPDAFTEGRKKTITVQVANPRNNDVKNVILEATGPGITATPSKYFIGNMAAGGNQSIDVAITPDRASTLTLSLQYNNGDNLHTVTTDLPLNFGTDKKEANPIVSNIIVKTENGLYHVTGDVTNAGLETANSVTVTSLDPAVPQDPYRNYVVGALKPDDFGSFEVTFSATNATKVPLQMSFKDADGNLISSVYDVKIPSLSATSQNSGLPIVPIIAVIIILAVFAGGWFWYLHRKKQ